MHLARQLLFAVFVYRFRADEFGELDAATERLLKQIAAGGGVEAVRLTAQFDQRRSELKPDTILMREWNVRAYHLMVVDDGFAGNGKSYDSLSKVEFATTGTNWHPVLDSSAAGYNDTIELYFRLQRFEHWGTMSADDTIEQITVDRSAHYEPFGWHHWPEHPWLSYQFRRGLGETQEGGGTVSEVFLAASRMIPGDLDSWHAEWMRVANENWNRGLAEEKAGHIRTAMNCFLRAADYYRQAEFHLEPTDPRRLPTFEKMEACSKKFLARLNPPGAAVDIPYEPGKPICGYFVRAPFPGGKLPVLICMGGLDSIKDEMWFMQAHGCLQRGISVLMIDGPGQGGTLRRHGIASRHDTEVPIGKCIDWLLTRGDVDPKRIAVCGSSMGGYYAARAACYEPRVAAAISHGAIWSLPEMWGNKGDDFGLAMHIRWVMGAKTMPEAHTKMVPFTLEGHLKNMKCPYLVLHGGHDVLTVSAAQKTYDSAIENGVDATLRILAPEETGAEHCQHDNPTIGQEVLCDWLADKFGIDQEALLKRSWSPLI